MTSQDPPTVLTALWESVETKWDEPHVHGAFLEACAAENQLAFAARKYREQKDGDNPTRRSVAKRQLEKITTMAVAQMAALKTPPRESKRALTIVAAVISGGLILACAYLMTL